MFKYKFFSMKVYHNYSDRNMTIVEKIYTPRKAIEPELHKYFYNKKCVGSTTQSKPFVRVTDEGIYICDYRGVTITYHPWKGEKI